MSVVLIILQVVWSLLAVGIVVAVLLHSAKGDGIAAIGGSAQLFSSQKSAERNLDRATWGIVAGFLAITVVLSAGWLGGSTRANVAPGGPQPATPTLPAPPAVPAPQPR